MYWRIGDLLIKSSGCLLPTASAYCRLPLAAPLSSHYDLFLISYNYFNVLSFFDYNALKATPRLPSSLLQTI